MPAHSPDRVLARHGCRWQEMDGRIRHYSHHDCSGATSAPSTSLSPTWAVTHTPQRMTSPGTCGRLVMTKRADPKTDNSRQRHAQSFLVPAIIPVVPVPKMPTAFLVKAPPATGLIPVMDTMGIGVESGLGETKDFHDPHYCLRVYFIIFPGAVLGKTLSASYPGST